MAITPEAFDKLAAGEKQRPRWLQASIDFTWQRPQDDESSTWAVARDGTGLRQLTDEQARDLDVPPAGPFDRARRRVLGVEGGDIVLHDIASGERRRLTRTAGNELANCGGAESGGTAGDEHDRSRELHAQILATSIRRSSR